MSAPVLPITEAVVRKAENLFDLLRVCEQAARSLNDVGDGLYRENMVASLANTIEFATGTLEEIRTALELAQMPASSVGAEGGAQ